MIKFICKSFENLLCKNKFILNLYQKYYKATVAREINLSNIKETDRILCIGGGAAPCTALQLYYQSGASVDVLDNDDRAIIQSRKLIRKLGLDKKIRIIKGDGRKINTKSYDIVHIALQVEPKKDVLDNVWKNSSKGQRIIVRDSKKLLSCFYSQIPKKYKSKNLNKRKSLSIFTTMTDPLILEKC